jgi:hypothetical protein
MPIDDVPELRLLGHHLLGHIAKLLELDVGLL